jgi:ribosomal protein L29
MTTTYEHDIVAWAKEQAYLLRSGKLSAIDIEHIAEEIEDVGKSEQRELASRMAVLLSHLLKWQYQSARQSSSWQRTIKEQRKAIARRLKNTPSLKASIYDLEWLADAWGDAISITINETGMDCFPESCPWTIENILAENWLPSSAADENQNS